MYTSFSLDTSRYRLQCCHQIKGDNPYLDIAFFEMFMAASQSLVLCFDLLDTTLCYTSTACCSTSSTRSVRRSSTTAASKYALFKCSCPKNPAGSEWQLVAPRPNGDTLHNPKFKMAGIPIQIYNCAGFTNP